MALTREAVLCRIALLNIGSHMRLLGLALTSLLGACAQGAVGSEIDNYELFDASTVTNDPPPVQEQEAGVILAPFDSGGIVPNVPDSSTTRDAGSSTPDAGTVKPADAGMTSPPLDSGTTNPPLDSGTTKPLDAGTTPPVDSGTIQPKPDAGTSSGQTCAATPAYPTKTSCAMCTCTKCASQVAACYGSSDSAKNTQCASVQGCAETNHCAGEACYCGTSITCLLADGACISVIESAAGTASVSSAGNDPENPVGRAKAVGECELANCKSECGL